MRHYQIHVDLCKMLELYNVIMINLFSFTSLFHLLIVADPGLYPIEVARNLQRYSQGCSAGSLDGLHALILFVMGVGL